MRRKISLQLSVLLLSLAIATPVFGQTAIVYQNTTNVATEADGGILKNAGTDGVFNAGGISTVQITSADLPATVDWSIVTNIGGGFPGGGTYGLGTNIDHSTSPALGFWTSDSTAFIELREGNTYRGDCAVGAGVLKMELADNGSGGATVTARCNGSQVGTTYTVSLPIQFDVNLAETGTGLVSASMTLSSGGGGGATVTVCASGCTYTNAQLQTAINDVEVGGTVLLQENFEYVGAYTLPVKAGAGPSAWTTIRTGVNATGVVQPLSNYPAAGVRVCQTGFTSDTYACGSPGSPPAYDAEAIFASCRPNANNANCFATANVAGGGTPPSYWRIKWMDFHPHTYGGDALISIHNTSANQTTGRYSHMPGNIEIDQIMMHSDTVTIQKRGFALHGRATTIKNSHLILGSWHNAWGGSGSGSEGQVIWCNGPGPYTIENNLVAGATENFMCGGGGTHITSQFTVQAGSTSTNVILDRLDDLVVGQAVEFLAGTVNVTSSSAASPTVITTATTHSFQTGWQVWFTSHTSGAPNNLNRRDIAWNVTNLTGTTFSINANQTGAGSGGTVSARLVGNITAINTGTNTITVSDLPIAPTVGSIARANAVPDGITIRYNYFTTPDVWRTQPMLPTPTITSVTATTGGTLTAGTYGYRVVTRVFVSAGQGLTVDSVPSSEQTTPISGGDNAVTIVWPAQPNAAAYRVYRTTGTGSGVYFEVAAGTTSFTDTGGAGTAGSLPAGSRYMKKNVLELKTGKNGLIEHNVIERSWLPDQTGPCIVFTPASQSLEAPSATIEDVIVRYNVIRYCGELIQLRGGDSGAESDRTEDITFTHNLFYNWGEPYGTYQGMGNVQTGGSTRQASENRGTPIRVTFTHNTAWTGAGVTGPGQRMVNLVLDSPSTINNLLVDFTFRDNLMREGTSASGSHITGQGMCSNCFGSPTNPFGTGKIFSHLVFAGHASCAAVQDDGTNITCPTVTDIETNTFTSSALNSADDFKIRNTSSYFTAASDGTMIGANLDLIYPSATEGVSIAENGNASGQSAPLNIDTTSLPNGTQGAAYSQTPTITGGTLPYSCSITSGTLPAGITLTGATSCTISGTPTVNGSFPFTFHVLDGLGATDDQAYTLVIDAPAALTITTTSLPNPVLGVPYSQTLVAIGGTPPYTWSRTGATMIAGLTFNASTGVLSGTPLIATSTARSYTFTVTDSASATDNQIITLSSIRRQVRDIRYNGWTMMATFQQAAAPVVADQVSPGDLWADTDDGIVRHATCTASGTPPRCTASLTWNLLGGGASGAFATTFHFYAGQLATQTPGTTANTGEIVAQRANRVKVPNATNFTEVALTAYVGTGNTGMALALQWWDGGAWQTVPGLSISFEVANNGTLQEAPSSTTYVSLPAGARVQNQIFRVIFTGGDTVKTVTHGAVQMHLR